MEQQELNKLMIDSANDAVNLANTEFKLTLDYSEKSISEIDTIIVGFLDKYKAVALEDKAIFTICNLFGAYLGQTFMTIKQGQWLYDQTNENAPSVFMKSGEHSFAFAGICYKKLVEDSTISINDYFQQAILSSAQK
ncbi:hypothetical protein [Glaciecola petra]|uniref:DUF3806 domain-containing protein n=1 Tax=Glaciecola petra TaxID=3075602 RepID=A0ABU2ZPD1_9ALTE|nr:hypothetical protein [Aestuariibacter sp. P117]MDT0594478.1 hypothetical protein [Aestuariibacter sp. P117]